MSNPVGRPLDQWRQAWKMRFGLGDAQAKALTEQLMRQLSFCKSDEARRIILGKSAA